MFVNFRPIKISAKQRIIDAFLERGYPLKRIDFIINQNTEKHFIFLEVDSKETMNRFFERFQIYKYSYERLACIKISFREAQLVFEKMNIATYGDFPPVPMIDALWNEARIEEFHKSPAICGLQ